MKKIKYFFSVEQGGLAKKMKILCNMSPVCSAFPELGDSLLNDMTVVACDEVAEFTEDNADVHLFYADQKIKLEITPKDPSHQLNLEHDARRIAARMLRAIKELLEDDDIVFQKVGGFSEV